MNKKGFALSIVLWIVAALLFGIATLAILSKNTQMLTMGVSNKLNTQLIAEDILENLKFYILTADWDNNSYKHTNFNNKIYSFPNKIILDGRYYSINKNIKISIEDTSRMLNVFKARASILSKVATQSSQRQERYTIEDSIKDWQDSDNVVRLNGAERSRYNKNGFNFKIRNSVAIQHIEELKLVNGINSLDENSWKKLKEKLYFGRGTVVNLTLIDSRYLENLFNIHKAKAQTLVKIREENIRKFINLIYEEKNRNEDMGFGISKQLIIKIYITKDDTGSSIEALIDFKKNKNKLYNTISYQVK